VDGWDLEGSLMGREEGLEQSLERVSVGQEGFGAAWKRLIEVMKANVDQVEYLEWIQSGQNGRYLRL
jgi:hypothetical protein